MGAQMKPAARGSLPHFHGITAVSYPGQLPGHTDVTVIDTQTARRTMATAHFLEPQRLDFNQLLLFTRGRGTHTVDLLRYPVGPGSLVLVKSGQVQEWDNVHHLFAKMLLFRPFLLATEHREHECIHCRLEKWPVCLQLPAGELRRAEKSIDEISNELEHGDGSCLGAELVHHMIYVLLLRLRQAASALPTTAGTGGEESSLYRLFRTELERTFSQTRKVRDYATRLGYSEKSLYRAAVCSTGVTPKQLIDHRVALEAQRLLVHTDRPLKSIAHDLGFSEPTNFTKFFKRMVGRSPEEFRRCALHR